MGYGDALIAAGMAERLFNESPDLGPVVICNCDGRPRWRDEWRGNPAIRQGAGEIRPSTRLLCVGRGCAPYHPWSRDLTFRFRDYRPTLYLDADEIDYAADVYSRFGPYLLLEPAGLDRKNVNRNWPTDNWPNLIAILRERVNLPLVQLVRAHADRVPGLEPIPHSTFREACAIVRAAELSVLPSGGLSIGAAAVRAPAIVLWGGCDSAETGGFPEHVALVDDDPRSPCGGFTKPCPHCAEAWARLTPEKVAATIQSVLMAQARSRALESAVIGTHGPC